MKKSMNNKIKALQSKVENQAEFMKKLAELDEKGQLTQDVLDQVNGGAPMNIKSPIIDLPVLGIWLPPTSPDMTI
ncbi:hypothetical protein [Spirosoma radiotolerans]|uniref:Uncharacterized protein n=1 Tax=Spirosoma radiotolerans TaxID=1379870 RepID=A0A0E4A0M0_9BACT|nr:hypothetical protein [Spirosoma radiotolerans]AKD58212.1 hypothetical protein SD10_28230 [Spirosoma radiotolerans]